jgi:hypothetical protein
VKRCTRASALHKVLVKCHKFDSAKPYTPVAAGARRQGNPWSNVTAATVGHLLSNTQQANNKCSLAGKVLPDGGRVADLGRPVLLRIIERRAVPVSRRARAAMLGLLVLAP